MFGQNQSIEQIEKQYLGGRTFRSFHSTDFNKFSLSVHDVYTTNLRIEQQNVYTPDFEKKEEFPLWGDNECLLYEKENK